MIHLHRSLWFAAALALVGCGREPDRAEDKSEPTVEPKPEPSQLELAPILAEPDLSSFDMPGADVAWSIADYTAAGKAIAAIAKQDETLLPRAGSSTFARMAEVDHLRQLATGLQVEQLAGLSLSLGSIHGIYGNQTRRDPSFERELLLMTAALIATTTRLPTATIGDEAQALALRDEPTKLNGLLRFRHGVYEMVEGMLEPEPKSVLPPGFACEQLARVIDDAAPLLLDDERTSLRTRVQSCTGADAEALAQLDRALAAETPTAALVSALLAEHREYKTAH